MAARWHCDGDCALRRECVCTVPELRVNQPIHVTRDGSGGLEALLEVRNLLAEGYRPYILSDGSLLLFADDQRSLSAGLAFTF